MVRRGASRCLASLRGGRPVSGTKLVDSSDESTVSNETSESGFECGCPKVDFITVGTKAEALGIGIGRDAAGQRHWRVPARFPRQVCLLKRAIGVVHQRSNWHASVSPTGRVGGQENGLDGIRFRLIAC